MPLERADVVVIGSGAAGAAVTWRLATRGVAVVCLEQGDWLRPGDFASEQRDFEASLRRGRHALFPNDRKRPEDYPVTTAGDGPAYILMWNGVGGSTVHWEGHFPRLHPSDFAVRRLDGIAEDWPISYDDLESFYDLNDSIIGVSGLAGDPANPPRTRRPTPPLPLGRSGEAVVRGFERLGWHWWPSDTAIISRDYDGRTSCDNRGRCNFGCPLKAKASADVVYWPRALKAGARLTVRARVQEIAVGHDGRVTGVVYRDRDGAVQLQPARRGGLLQRHRYATLAPRVEIGAVPSRSRELQWPGRQLVHESSKPLRRGHLRRAIRNGDVQRQSVLQPAVLRDRSRATVRARLFIDGVPAVRTRQRRLGRQRAGPLGQRASSRDGAAVRTQCRDCGHGRGPARRREWHHARSRKP